MAEELPASFVATCPVCGQVTTWVFLAHWTDVPEGMEPFDVYNCASCGATRCPRTLSLGVDIVSPAFPQ